METLFQDLRHALRALRRRPGFAAVAVLTLGLGIGTATALFSVVEAVLLRPLPYPDADRIVQVWQVNDEGGHTNLSDPNFADLREAGRGLEAMAQYAGGVASVTGAAEPVRAPIALVSADFFRVMGVAPVRGRAFVPEEQREGGAPAVVVSHAFWRDHLGADPAFAGRTLTFEGRAHTVVGVMPEGFAFPEGTALWTARELSPVYPSRTAHNWKAVGRLREGVSPQAAQASLGAVARRLKAELGDDTWMADAALVPLHEEVVGRVRPALLLLMGAAGLLLLIACANVANLLLARAASRRRELAVRAALGAGRGRLVRHFLAESLVLCLGGAALGVWLAGAGVDLLAAMRPEGLPRVDEVGVSGAALAFALGVSLLVALVLGLLTAGRSGGADVRAAMSEAQGGQSGGVASRRLRGALVAGQVALTLVMLIGAGLLARSFVGLLAVDPGFRTEGAAVMSFQMASPQDEGEAARQVQLREDLFARIRAIPGVREVGGVNDLPLSGGGGNGSFLILSRPDEVTDYEGFGRLAKDPSRVGEAEFRAASGGYFAAMGIPLLRGRGFEERDTPDAAHVALISESLARARWPGEDPIGKLIQFGNMDGDLRAITIVGVVGDVREFGLDAEPRPTFYVNARQRPGSAYRFHVVMAGEGDPSGWAAPARAALRDLAPDVPPRLSLLEQVYSESLAARRFSLLLLGAFGTSALLLAVAGVYGVISYAVSQRTREFGIRVALGARGEEVVGQVVREGLALVAVGVLVGLAGAAAGTRLLASMLYGVGALDPVTFAAVPLLLGGVAVLASLGPARRASRVSPVTALRAE